MLRPNLCDYSDAYILVKDRIMFRLDHAYQKSVTQS